jgi:hypothetical protein
MKRFVLACLIGLLSAGSLWAVTSFTPTIDGSKDVGWGSTPDNSSTTLLDPTNFNLDGGMYVTDDASYIYFGFDADLDPWGDSKSVHAHVLFDVGNTAIGGTYDAWGAGGVTYAMPYLPDYDIIMQWSTDDSTVGWTGFESWNSSSTGWWDQVQLPDSNRGGGGGRFTEIRVPRNLIGLPAQGSTINISAWLRPAWDKWGTNCCLPADADFPTAWADNAGTFNSQFAYTVQTVSADFDPPGILSVRQLDRGSMEINFDEAMNTTTLNNSGNYTPHGWTFTGFRSVASTRVQIYGVGFADGGSYSVEVSSSVTDLSGNPMDPANDSAGWTCPDYTDVLVTCNDTTQTHDSLMFKGSWSMYHDYDGSWSNPLVLMYDDGTHGDLVAFDHIFSRAWYLTAGHIYEWGVTNERGDWLVQGPNPSFDLTTNDTTICYFMTYNEHELANNVDVTFHCDMQFVTDPVDCVRVAGSFNGWNGTSYVLTDPNSDGQWDILVHFYTNDPKRIEFKFQRMYNGTNWESVPNRVVEIDDSGPTWDAGNMLFNNIIGDPDSLTAFPVSSGVQVSWSGGTRIWFDVFSNFTPDSIMENGSIIGSTQSHSLIDTAMSGSLKKFYQVRARL